MIKILIISHNPFSTYQSMGKTFSSLFSAFEKEELCQLYIYPSFPNVDAVNSCYRITDRDVIKAMVPGICVGGEVSTHKYRGSMIENKIDGMLYAKKSNNSSLKRLVRDFGWKISNWYSHKFQEWLDKEAPNCIFLAPGYAKFIYDIALKIATKRNIPIITYICDDYYFPNTAKTWLDRYQQVLLRRKIQQIMKKSQAMVAISEEIKKQYSEEFLIDCTLIMTGANIQVSNFTREKQQIKTFSYFGNVGLNREKSLADIGRVLDEINLKCGTDYKLRIYTRATNAAVFHEINSVQICGFLTGKDFVEAFTEAECLVHVEAFDKETVNLVSGSISTKIADSLASGIPLLAYAPRGIASTEHLLRNECAFIADSYDCLRRVIFELLDNGERRSCILKNAIRTAKRYHISAQNSLCLKSLIEKIVGE